MRKAAKRDSVEPEIIAALESHGVVVTQLSQKGLPDLLCSKGQGWFLVECKSAKGKLTDDQSAFIEKHGAWVHIARSKADVEKIMVEP